MAVRTGLGWVDRVSKFQARLSVRGAASAYEKMGFKVDGWREAALKAVESGESLPPFVPGESQDTESFEPSSEIKSCWTLPAENADNRRK